MIKREFRDGVFWQADCFDVLPTVASGSVDLVLCDLPYGNFTRNAWDSVIPLDVLWHEYKRVVKPNGAVVLTACQPFTSALVMSNPRSFKYEWIFSKSVATGHLNAKKQPLRQHESVLVFYDKQCTYNPQFTIGKAYACVAGPQTTNYGHYERVETVNDGSRYYPKSIQHFKPDKEKLHPTQKPQELFEYLIKTYTDEGQLVLDNTAGVGTTAAAARATNRQWLCIEKDQGYFEKAIKRLD